jgi:glycosyltransferase involved in cell wall biosynthesis
MKRVINFSGGRTSALMTILEYKEGDLVIFCDTGREHPKTYKFLNDFEAFENIPIIRLKYEGGFERLIRKRKAVPNVMMRFCTIELKIKTARRYLRSIGCLEYLNFVGFRADEQVRIIRRRKFWKKVTDVFTLNEKKIIKKMVIDFWKQKEYDLEVPPILGNCDLCFLKGKNAIISILREQPELADKWINDEQEIGASYIKGTSYTKLLELSKLPHFKQQDLFELEPAFNCSCTS